MGGPRVGCGSGSHTAPRVCSRQKRGTLLTTAQRNEAAQPSPAPALLRGAARSLAGAVIVGVQLRHHDAAVAGVLALRPAHAVVALALAKQVGAWQGGAGRGGGGHR